MSEYFLNSSKVKNLEHSDQFGNKTHEVVKTHDVIGVNVDKEKLKNAPGFDKNNWPNGSDRTWGASIHKYYGVEPYWTEKSK